MIFTSCVIFLTQKTSRKINNHLPHSCRNAVGILTVNMCLFRRKLRMAFKQLINILTVMKSFSQCWIKWTLLAAKISFYQCTINYINVYHIIEMDEARPRNQQNQVKSLFRYIYLILKTVSTSQEAD